MGPYNEQTQYRRACSLASVLMNDSIDPDFRSIYEQKLRALASSKVDYMDRVKQVYPNGINVHLKAVIE